MNKERLKALRELEAHLGTRFEDIGLLDNALTHRSYVNENPSLPCRDNERLEFLGDAVLELTVSDMLMKKFPDCSEGELSKMRASAVNEQPLAGIARRFRIGEFLLLGRGEEASGGRQKPSLLANAFESIIAAMYIDAGFDRTAGFIGRLFEPLIEAGAAASLYRDYKTAVQEVCQNRFRELPRYILLSETGPDHDKRFEAGLVVGERVIAAGTGRNKKEAEQQAARAAMENLRETDPPPAAGTLPAEEPPAGARPFEEKA
jgi:ribonuclease III